jgi:hypothetical protein
MGRRKRKHDAPIKGDGLCPHESDDCRDSLRFGQDMELIVRRRVECVFALAIRTLFSLIALEPLLSTVNVG